MADVNLLMPAFGIVWAEDGNIAVIDEAQWKAGWSFIGSTPPSVAQFNKVMQIGDQKSNYLYQQLLAVQETLGSIGSVKFFDTYADATADLPNLSEDEVVEVGQDETRGGARTRYIVKSGALVFMVNLDQLRVDLAAPAGSSLVAFRQSGVDAKVRDLQEKTREIELCLNDFEGVDPTGATSSHDAIVKAVTEAMTSRRKLTVRPGRYVWDGMHVNAAHVFELVGDAGDLPVFELSQAAADAGARMFRFEQLGGETMLALDGTVKPNQRNIKLVSVAGLQAGMMLQISSLTLWYHDPRGEDTKGELHMIRSVDAANRLVWFDDQTRDTYNPSTETISVRAWHPNQLTMRNLRLVCPTPATAGGTVCVQFSKCLQPQFENIAVEGATFAGLLMMRCYEAVFRNIRPYACGNLAGNGYGIQDKGSVGTIIDGLFSWGCRRAVDFHGLSGAIGCVSRDWQVSNFVVRGGGIYYPDADIAYESYGLGMHGATEGGIFRDGYISDVAYGINARARSITIDNVHFGGTMLACVSASFGTGLIVRNCRADRGDYPNKLASFSDAVAGSGIGDFIRFGISTGSGPEAMWQWDLPTTVRDNTLVGVTSAFMRFMGDTAPRNICTSGNTIQATPGAAGTFYTYLGHSPAVDVTFNKCFLEEPQVELLEGSYLSRYSTVLMGYLAGSPDRAVRVGTSAFEIFLFDDDVAVIRRAGTPGTRITASFSADSLGRGIFGLIPGNAAFTNVAGMPAYCVATATGSALTGTTGVDGNITFGLMANGDLWIENRGGANRSFRITVLG